MTDPTAAGHAGEIARGERFAFGANWQRFLRVLDEDRISAAEDSLRAMLEETTLANRSFLDIGSGSGLFSLAARRLGARVQSFDYDPQSVACTRELQRRYFAGDEAWNVQEGSVLDREFLGALGTFDIVYSWGVLHHTGAMWHALENAAAAVAPGGRLFLALYNHQPIASRYWTAVKKLYNRARPARPLLVAVHFLYPTLPSIVLKLVQGRKYPRGMNAWHDLIDWLGGYPFEVSRPEEVFDFFRQRGFVLEGLKTAGGRLGCNEFVFRRRAATR